MPKIKKGKYPKYPNRLPDKKPKEVFSITDEKGEESVKREAKASGCRVVIREVPARLATKKNENYAFLYKSPVLKKKKSKNVNLGGGIVKSRKSGRRHISLY